MLFEFQFMNKLLGYYIRKLLSQSAIYRKYAK